MIRWQLPKSRRDRSLLVLCADVIGWGLIVAALMFAREILTVTGV